MFPGIGLRQVRERLGLTYRDVEQASYELAQRPCHFTGSASSSHGCATPDRSFAASF